LSLPRLFFSLSGYQLYIGFTTFFSALLFLLSAILMQQDDVQMSVGFRQVLGPINYDIKFIFDPVEKVIFAVKHLR
jgi:hypothetical protein